MRLTLCEVQIDREHTSKKGGMRRGMHNFLLHKRGFSTECPPGKPRIRSRSRPSNKTLNG
eukprot:10001795-Prorocentrum_lima.AAC.1